MYNAYVCCFVLAFAVRCPGRCNCFVFAAMADDEGQQATSSRADAAAERRARVLAASEDRMKAVLVGPADVLTRQARMHDLLTQ